MRPLIFPLYASMNLLGDMIRMHAISLASAALRAVLMQIILFLEGTVASHQKAPQKYR